MTGGDDRVAATIDTYDRVVDSYEDRASGMPEAFGRFRDAFVGLLPDGSAVVEAGCGPGRDLAFFRAAGLRVLGVDRSAGMVERARMRGSVAIVGDLRRLPIKSGATTGLWSAAALLHVPRDEVAETLRQWASCLEIGGVLGLSTSLGDSEGWEDVPYDVKDQPPTGVAPRRWFVHHDAESLVQMVGDAGFEIISVSERQTHRRWIQILGRRAA